MNSSMSKTKMFLGYREASLQESEDRKMWKGTPKTCSFMLDRGISLNLLNFHTLEE